MRCLAGCALSLFLLACIPAGAIAAPSFKAVSASGEVVFFETDDQLVPGDTDTKRDVYERYFDPKFGEYVTREVSLGPTGGNDAYNAQFEAANAAGTKVFFSTQERMVAEDTDRQVDIYMRDLTTGTTTLVSTGEAACSPGCGNGEFSATFAGINESGTEVFFTTAERLAHGDSDDSVDLYVRNLTNVETKLVSTAEAGCGAGCGNGEFDVSSRGISADGSHAYFATAEPLSSADGDTALDIYAHDVESGETYLVSRGGCAGCGAGGAVPVFDGSSADGDRVFFGSDEKLTEADTDSTTDIYARDLPNGPTILISGGSENITANFAAASADGSHVFFSTSEGLVLADTDGANDIYEWTEGSPLSLVTSSPCSSRCGVSFDAASSDSSQVVFNTAAQLSPEDQDAQQDVYRQHVGGGEPVLVSRGEGACTVCWNGSADVRFSRSSADASRVIFSTQEGILGEDTDGEDDIYLRDVGAESTRLITTSPSYCPLPRGSCGANFVGASADGRRVFFLSVERFTLEDGDNEADIYERFLGSSPAGDVTRLVSQGNDPNLELGPPSPTLTGTDPGSPGSSTTPRVLGEAEVGARVKVYATADCSGEPVAIGTAAELKAAGLPASVTPGSLTEFRATAEAEGFVSKCSDPVTYREIKEGGDEAQGGGSSGGGGGGTVKPVANSTIGNGDIHVSGTAYLIPQARITFAPAAETRMRSPIFRFTDSTGQPGTTFRCKIDGKGWTPCASPLRLKRLSDGRHVLQVLAVNGAGVAGPQAVKRVFKVVPR
jgi:Tol biopolymer transport system component